ncbi:hypothetical protein KGQ20_02930 [Catenulispora sp. NF23]|uniref:Uncharacterized protein n=1 Tax=Catenulispora pinistramenti TaxID=2705254 RepID=A0ABS5KQG6_9ACTN|nr:hypothetical protein [Catenulispora pinistramenti]MBS2548287.1 hypothetical protein [Catenulispora pinistramenti]
MTERRVTVADYQPGGSLRFAWAEGFRIEIDAAAGEVVVRANTAGLVSLAQHCLTLAQADVPPGSHLHLTDSVELEPGSGDLIIERAPDQS